MSEYISLQGIAVGILSGSEIMWWGTAARGVVQDAQCMVHTHTHDHQEPLSFLTPRFLFHSAVHENTIPVHSAVTQFVYQVSSHAQFATDHTYMLMLTKPFIHVL